MSRMGSIDTKALERFRDQVKQLSEDDEFMEACAKELAARLLSKVIKRTPVGQYPIKSGKKGGTLRRGWTNGEQTRNVASYVDSLPIEHVGTTYQITIINPVEYASYVEYGHRTANHRGWVKGQFMMTISEQELQQIAPRVLEAKLKAYMSKLQ